MRRPFSLLFDFRRSFAITPPHADAAITSYGADDDTAIAAIISLMMLMMPPFAITPAPFRHSRSILRYAPLIAPLRY